jgi:predicted adenine nucleotide alpha hydrolase (AANH) superfamily ATPase
MEAQPGFHTGQTTAEYHEPALQRPALLLHSCCGPCSTAVVERLCIRFRVTIYFCNSNIDDEEEYNNRLRSQRLFVETWNTSEHTGDPVSLIAAPYRPEAFLESVKGYEEAKEGGARCRICIFDRMEKTAAFAAMNGFEIFTTTLSVSPHKDFGMISEFGQALALRYRIHFLAEDFKKQNGFGRSCELARAYDLYRQNYCGCCFSKRDAEAAHR